MSRPPAAKWPGSIRSRPFYDIKTMERAFFEALASNRVVTGLFAACAAVALGLAMVGSTA